MKISFGSITLLRHVLANNGKKEITEDGREVNSPRRLSGEEAAQRRHFFKNTHGFIQEKKPKIDEVVKKLTDKFESIKKDYLDKNPKKEGENEQFYNIKLKDSIEKDEGFISQKEETDKLYEEEVAEVFEVEVTDQTLEVIKKYYKEFGDKVGFVEADDKAVEEIENLIK